jgi:16S rRNA (adenine1518-N6/adenine1519-N6)-dimethyltransferase
VNPKPRKRFGQHFLHDPAIIQRIVAAFDAKPADVVAEIGPGPGVLTRALAGHVHSLHAVEIDRDLAAERIDEFADNPEVAIHTGDALEFDFCSLTQAVQQLRVIGNLPYNISTPLLFHLLEQAACIRDMLFMLQKEVVDRMVAAPGGRDYGRLSVMVQWRCQVERLFVIGPGAFRPPPRVDSAVVRLRPYTQPPVTVDQPQWFARIVREAFSHRRKTLRNALGTLLTADEIERTGTDGGRRPETLSVAEFAAIANASTAPGDLDRARPKH